VGTWKARMGVGEGPKILLEPMEELGGLHRKQVLVPDLLACPNCTSPHCCRNRRCRCC
jgi:hypothetical protein